MIRKALPSEVSHCVNLMTMAAEKELKFVFGDEATIKKILSHLAQSSDNLFSRDYAWVDEDDKTGDVRGMISLVKGRNVSGLKFNMIFHLSAIYKFLGFSGLSHVFREGMLLSSTQPKIRGEEFYINSIAVYPEFRGRKVGSGLLRFAFNYAKVVHYNKICLAVEMGNEKAFNIYKRLGFKVTGTKAIKKNLRKYGFAGHFKMTKEL